MRRFLALITTGLLASCAAASQPVAQGDTSRPTVIELYQSQGCSSCPPALAVLDQLVGERPDVLALNFAVTYWDQLGWKDQYAQPGFTARQWDYAHAQGRGNVQTPQLIVNGSRAVLGSRKGEVESAIAAAHRTPGPDIAVAGNHLTIGTGAKARGQVWIVDYDPRRVPVAIGAGENGGRTLVHRNIVRHLVSIGAWTGSAATYNLPAAHPGLSRAVLVQVDKGGSILGAKRL